MRIEHFQSGLHPRSFSFNRAGAEPNCQLVLVTDGSGEVEQEESRFALSGPALLWLPGLAPGRLRLDAGTMAYRASIPSDILVAAIGEEMESVELRYLAGRSFTLSLTGREDVRATLERALTGMLAEYRQPGAAGNLLVSGLLRIILVRMLRAADSTGLDMRPGAEPSGPLQRFRQLVEMHFREHWPVQRYADELGISTDRLHALCRAATGKPPKRLIAERIAREAALRLERTALTIQQLAHSLGFNDPAHFSNHFRRVTGLPPGAYRKRLIARAPDGADRAEASFADWP